MKQNVFVTKYALTAGIIECELDVKPNNLEGGGILPNSDYYSWFGKGEFHSTKEEALKDCEKRRFRKLVSLEKQMSKLQKLTFK
jgi:hypothetical protein